MTLQANGQAICNDCGGPAGNGGVADALVVSDLDFGTGNIVTLHFCRIGVSGTSCAARRLAGVTAANYPHTAQDAASWHAAQVEAAKVVASAEQITAAAAGGGAGLIADGVVLSPEQSQQFEAEQAKPKRTRRPRKSTK